ncbi:hypothetical protein EHEL_061230 [Encephalitozoon hellem ATCC 50504]|uniref:ARS-binding factor 2 n=1 Tax=Encephalitozoon hellem TaxID=27973 RepID=A0A9Q9F8B2_ENCHE|nr:uncharacterized protein EHEL_061230 [Encephalitozoon hellem ATCC 50504]AFM98493.1 hypothetical protein EHEL_061230 [Encephalitozoon hellem ATCC 50504]UTX43419.1 ARS-binding factor 2 [Encephalitozoon hellem]|eukprot:XP_003887474.1 hypothetical protein EHEL_061230 [Encephalitozoon hellem ATCC 50504]
MKGEPDDLYEMPTKQRSPYSVFAREFFRDNRNEYPNCVDLAKALVKVWNEMEDEEKSIYAERCDRGLSDTRGLEGDEGNMSCDKNTISKLKRYVKAECPYKWEYSGYLFFVNEIFDICGDMTVSPEENVCMFAEMWDSLDDETQNKYRNKALNSLAAEKTRKKCTSEPERKNATKGTRPQRDSNPQPSAP